MILSSEPGDSLFGGGSNSYQGKIFCALHDATLDPSSGLKHAANLLPVMNKNAMSENSLPYAVLAECLY